MLACSTHQAWVAAVFTVAVCKIWFPCHKPTAKRQASAGHASTTPLFSVLALMLLLCFCCSRPAWLFFNALPVISSDRGTKAIWYLGVALMLLACLHVKAVNVVSACCASCCFCCARSLCKMPAADLLAIYLPTCTFNRYMDHQQPMACVR